MPDPDHSRPHFELRQVPTQGEPGPVQFYELDALPDLAPTLHLKRRDLLTLAGLSTTVLFTAACAGLPALSSTATPAKTPTRTGIPVINRTPTRTRIPHHHHAAAHHHPHLAARPDPSGWAPGWRTARRMQRPERGWGAHHRRPLQPRWQPACGG